MKKNIQRVALFTLLSTSTVFATAGLLSKDSDAEVAKRVEGSSKSEIPARFSFIAQDPIAIAIPDSSLNPEVGVGIQELDYRNIKGFILYFRFRNNSNDQLAVQLEAPKVLDKDGYSINPLPLGQFLARGAQMAGSSIPNIPDKNFTFSGTVTNTNGSSAYVSGRGTVGNPYDMSSGIAAGMARARREVGNNILNWGMPNWLLSSYDLSPGAVQVGAIYFPQEKIPYPIKVQLKINGQFVAVEFPAQSGK